MSAHLQDSNAGNLGDYLKHFFLIELLSKLRSRNRRSIAYVDTHAGAGEYKLLREHWSNRTRYRNNVCEDATRWLTFDCLNAQIESQQIYRGSFVLAGLLLLRLVGIRSTLVLYEEDLEVVKRIQSGAAYLLPQYKLGPFGQSTLEKIVTQLGKLRVDGYEDIVCLVDPYWCDGKADAAWCALLKHEQENCFILVFDVTRARGKGADGRLKFSWHCNEDHLLAASSFGCMGYAVFGNQPTMQILGMDGCTAVHHF